MKIELVSKIVLQQKTFKYLKSKLKQLNSDYYGAFSFDVKGSGSNLYDYIPNFSVSSKMKTESNTRLAFELRSVFSDYVKSCDGSKIISGKIICSQIYRVPSKYKSNFNMLQHKTYTFDVDMTSHNCKLESSLQIVDSLVDNFKFALDSIWQQIDTDPISASHPDYPRQQMKTAVDIVNKAKRNAILLNDENVDSRIVETNNRLMNKIIDEENGVTFWGKLTRSFKSMFVPMLSPELEVAILLLQNWSVFVCFQEQNSDCEISENLLCNFRAHESLIFDQYCESLGSNDRVLFNELIVPVYRAVKARMQNIATEESLNTDVLFKEVVAAVGWSSR